MTPPRIETFDQLINWLMQEHRLTQRQLAATIGVSDSQVSRWRRGLGGVSVEAIDKICERFPLDRQWVKSLANLGDSTLASTIAEDPAMEAERQRWRQWFDELREKKVPRSLWTAYTAACEGLAESFSSAQSAVDSALSTDEPKRISKPRQGRQRPRNGAGGDLTLGYHAHQASSQIASLLVAGNVI